LISLIRASSVADVLSTLEYQLSFVLVALSLISTSFIIDSLGEKKPPGLGGYLEDFFKLKPLARHCRV
jgi:hypothetical protein